jgi:PadR family transcriptional regulator, regulatory protein PadR
MANDPHPLVPGTLDLLILKAVSLGERHGYGVLLRLQQMTGGKLGLEQGAIYPALYRLERQDLIAGEWGTSDNNRRAKYYRLTPTGRKQLAAQTTRWEEIVRAIGRILKPSTE